MKYLWIALAFILVAFGFYFYVTEIDTGIRNQKAKKLIKQIEEMDKNLAFDYPNTPLEVIKMNNLIVQFLYGDYMNEKAMQKYLIYMIEVQRKFLDTELLENNDLNLQIAKLKTDLNEFKKQKIKIISTQEVETENDGFLSLIKVIETTNVSENMYKEYGLRIDATGQWKIFGFKKTPQFFID